MFRPPETIDDADGSLFFLRLLPSIRAQGLSPRPWWGCRSDGECVEESRTGSARGCPAVARATGLACPLNHTDRSPNDALVPMAPRGPEETGHGLD
jgi:hypothetical protein